MPGRALERGKGEESPRFQLLLPTPYSLSSWAGKGHLSTPHSHRRTLRLPFQLQSCQAFLGFQTHLLPWLGKGWDRWTQNSLGYILCPQHTYILLRNQLRETQINEPVFPGLPWLLVQQVPTLPIFEGPSAKPRQWV